MVVMEIAIVIVAIALVGAVVARFTWRQGVDERHSVRDYQNTLETLRHMSDHPGTVNDPRPTDPGRSGTGSRRAGADAGRAKSDSAHASASASQRRAGKPEPEAAGRRQSRAKLAKQAESRQRVPDEERKDEELEEHPRPTLVFDDLHAPQAPRETEPEPAGASGEALAGHVSYGAAPVGARAASSGRRDRSATAVNRLPLGVIGGVAAALVVVLVVSLVVVGGGSPPAKASHHREASSRTVPTSPVVTAPPAVQPTAFTATEASYSAPASGYSVVVRAALGECWIMATNLTTGAVVFQGLLTNGQSRTIPGSGGLQVELGAASAASVTLNGVQIALPQGFHSPFYVTFKPA